MTIESGQPGPSRPSNPKAYFSPRLAVGGEVPVDKPQGIAMGLSRREGFEHPLEPAHEVRLGP